MTIGKRIRKLLIKWIKNPRVVQGKWTSANEEQAEGRLNRKSVKE